ncbi:MAG TPA: TonB-dependent receptor [Candidatus Elarobacter sp.]|nr:TonB-dependent receptor [Candidatus Elarobacter sp.]
MSLALLLAFVLCSMPSAFAQTVTGNIQGTITDSQGNTKLAGVAVSAVAPSGRYSATSDQNGFFNVNGVSPDTYTITFTTKGYETYSLTGVTVVQGQTANATAALNKSLANIGRTQARSTTGAFQPTQTTDQYNVGVQGITTTLGKQGASSESNLLASIPGASFDSSGYPVLRGGREYEEGFQYEGIDYTDAFTHQFTNSLILNGAANFQVQPGAGDASVGNAGTGAINIVAKRGTNPGFGQFELGVFSGRYEHDLRGEYGWASPNGRYSNYSSYYRDNVVPTYGPSGVYPLLNNCFFNCTSFEWDQDVLNNFVFKFGKDNGQSLQFFYENTSLYAHLGAGIGPQGLPFKDNDPFTINSVAGFGLGLTVGQIQALYPYTLGQTALTQRYGGQQSTRQNFNYNQPSETFKLQYSNNLNATTFLTAKFYRVNAVALFDLPNAGNGTLFTEQVSLQGGQRAGFAIDGTKQFGSKNLVGFGGKYDFLRPVYSQPSATNAFFGFGGFGANQEIFDFLPNNAACPNGPGGCGYLLGNNATGTAYCTPFSQGNQLNLATGLNTGPALPAACQLPYSDESTSTNRQDFAFYVKDTFSPTDRLKFDFGLRMDGVNWKRPACDINQCLPTSSTTSGGVTAYQFNYSKDTLNPRVLQPRAAVSFQATKNDAFRFSYGRSVQFAPIASADVTGSRMAYSQYNNTPSFYNGSFGGATGPATFCGVTGDQLCKSYADQLYWENQNVVLGVPIQPLLPTTYNNFDFSYSRLFPHQVSMKITPFYNKSFNQVAATNLPIIKNGVVQTDPVTGAILLGPSVNTNLGQSHITGVEFLLTKEAAYGLSGSLSMTYQNEFSNVVPTSASEDFFPSIPPASLALGNLYRVGFLSPFVGTLSFQERTRNGWRINPVIYYNHGYPIGQGLLTANTVNGVNYNLPNTNVTNSAQLSGSNGAPQYVDPRNPGSQFKPNVDATRGTPETAAAGGILNSARFTPVQLTIEYQSPKNPHSTFGAVVYNVFNNLFSRPSYNLRYQPVATGIAAPYSGYTSGATNPAFYGFRNYTAAQGNQAYIINQGQQPRRVDFYYQLNL